MKRAHLVLTLLLGVLTASRAWADERYFALAVGYNGSPAGRGDVSSSPLRYADDDALSFYELEQEVGADAAVLTIPDADTRRRYPWAVDVARPPTVNEIERTIGELNKRMDAAAKAGHVPVFIFFYSGHGSRPQNGEPAFALLDGALSDSVLHDRVIRQVHAGIIHLVVDACHADAVVRPRDAEAATADVTQAELVRQLSAETTTREPNVGLVLASGEGNASHEWDLYQAGVFTHEVISGLRGAADINQDGRVEYSELGAFLQAANREVVDARARLRSVVRPPLSQARAALIALDGNTSTGWLSHIPASAGQFFVEDQQGNRILDAHAEPGFAMSVAIPPGRLLFVHDGEREAELFIARGAHRRFDTLDFHKRPLLARDAMGDSLEKGLFLRPFGPGYYSGYVDSHDAVSVVAVSQTELPAQPIPRESVGTKRDALVWSLRGTSVALLGSSLAFAALAWNARSDFQASSTQVMAAQANDRFGHDSTLAVAFLVPAVASAVASYLLASHR